MESLKALYKIGHGPSSSHTMAPGAVTTLFIEKFSAAEEIKVVLYGSLALTGIGHLTVDIIKNILCGYKHTVVLNKKDQKSHPNTMELSAYINGNTTGFWEVISIGGGNYKIINGDKKDNYLETMSIYPHKTFKQIKKYCVDNELTLEQYVVKCEGQEIIEYMHQVYDVMNASIERGLCQSGFLPGKLKVKRKAKDLFESSVTSEIFEFDNQKKLSAYAYAVAEENAAGSIVVTAPTCGASGVLPAVLRYMAEKPGVCKDDIIKALLTAGLIGNLIKHNASISGAVCGCQAEIGSACSMAASACATLLKLDLDKIEAAAEVALEHSLGLTCDPIYGYVQIPCIERNAIGALKSVNAAMLATFTTSEQKISFDLVVDVMYKTGLDLRKNYRETSRGGLALLYKKEQGDTR